MKRVTRHEIEHAVQEARNISLINKYNQDAGNPLKYLFRPKKGRLALEEAVRNTTDIDELLKGLELRKTPEKVDWNAIKSSDKKDPAQLFEYMSNKQRATNYFDSGSGGKEKSAFLGEVQQYMMDNNIIPKTSYVEVTPEMVKNTFVDAMFDETGGGKYLRLFNIMKPTEANYKLISEGLNKMLGLVPPAAIIGAGAMQEQKYGGALPKAQLGKYIPSWLNPYNWGVEDYSQYKTKKQAYAAAKKAGEEEFMWNNQRFNTKYAGTPRQEVGAYGVNGRPILLQDVNQPIELYKYPAMSFKYMGHIAADNMGNVVDYGPTGNYKNNTLESLNTYNVYGVDKNVFNKKSKLLPVRLDPLRKSTKEGDWTLFTNNCADNICDAFGIPRSEGIQLPSDALSKIKEKYPTLDVTGRTYEDYYDLGVHLRPISFHKPEQVLNQAKNLIGIISSPDLSETDASKKIVFALQNALSKKGYKLPKSTKEDGSFDGVFGDETKTALLDYQSKLPKKQLAGENYIPASESTGVNTYIRRYDLPVITKEMQDERELARRKQAIQASQKAGSKPFFSRERWTPENFALETGATGDKLRFFPDDPDSFIDEYLNPLKMIGDMASGLGRMPLNISQGNYGQAAMSVATPLVAGVTAGLGAKSAGQFVNNLANPLAGTGQFLTTKTPLKNANKYNPLAFKAKKGKIYRQVGQQSILSELEQSFANLNPKNLKTQSGLDWMKRWYSDPDFIRRLDPYERLRYNDDIELKKYLLSQLDQYRLYSPENISVPELIQEIILMRLNQYQPKNYIDLLKDKGFRKYLKHSFESSGVSSGVPEGIYVNRTNHAPFDMKGLESTRVHELSHLTDFNGRLLFNDDQERLLKPFGYSNIYEIPEKNPGFFRKFFLNDDPQYYLNPTEIHARMNQARFKLGLSPKDEFTEQMFDEISKDTNWYGMGRYIKDKKAFIDLMNNFWAVPPAAVAGAAAASEKQNAQPTMQEYENGGPAPTYFGGTLPEVMISSDGTSYPYYNKLTAEEKKYFNQNSPIGRAVRSIASTGKRGETANDLREIARGVEKFGFEMTGIPGSIRFSQDPVKKLKGLGRTVDATILGSSPFITAPYNKEDVADTFDALDAFGFATLAFAPLKTPLQQGIKSSAKYLTQGPLRNAYMINPWAFKPKPNMYYRQVGEPGYLNAIQENRVLAKGQKEFLEQNRGFNYWDDYDKLTGYKNKTGFFSLEKPKVAPFFQKGELFFPISNRTGFGRGKTAASDVKYLFEGNLPDEAILPRYRDKYLTREEFLGDYTGGTGVLDPKYSDLSNFKIYKKDWWMGYKPVEVPKQLGGMTTLPKAQNGEYLYPQNPLYPKTPTDLLQGILTQTGPPFTLELMIQFTLKNFKTILSIHRKILEMQL
jgi:peptidoglycan hydrolase-like protein with peptidoglycan-binding domain